MRGLGLPGLGIGQWAGSSGGGPAPNPSPVLLGFPSADAPDGLIGGKLASVFLPTWENETSETAHWTLDGVNSVTVSGNNPLTIPYQDGAILGLRFTATNANGTTTYEMTLGAISAPATEPVDPPTVLTAASYSGGMAAGSIITPTFATFEDATTVVHEWWINGAFYSPASGPFTLPDLPGQGVVLKSIGTNEEGSTESSSGSQNITSGAQWLSQTMFDSPSGAGFGRQEPANQTLSLKFIPKVDGRVSSIRFRKHANDTATSRPWSILGPTGTVLASGTTSNEPTTDSWHIQPITPLAVTKDIMFEVCLFYADGWIFAQTNRFTQQQENGQLIIPAGTVNSPTAGNGRYRDGGAFGPPNLSWYNSYYWIDITFEYQEAEVPATVPVLLTPASITAPDGYVVGAQLTAVPATYSGATSEIHEWELDQETLYAVTGNNPITITSDMVGKRPGLWSRGINAQGTTPSLVIGDVVAEAPAYTTEYGESITVKSGTSRGSEGTGQTLATQFRFLKEGWLDGFRFVKHASDPTTSRAYRVWDYPSTGSTSGDVLVSGTTSGEATGTEHVEEVLFPTPYVYSNIGDIVEIGYYGPNPGWTLAKTEEYNADRTNGQVVTRGYASGSNGPNGNSRYQAGGAILQPNESWYNSDYYIRPIFRYLTDGEPPPPPPPPPGVWPGPDNTGVPAGVTLTNVGALSLNNAGAVIENLRINGDVQINAPNIEIRNCYFNTAGLEYGLNMGSINYGGAGQPGLYVHDCTFVGGGSNRYAIKARGRFDRLNISGCENGISITGISNSGYRNGCEVTNCWIHDLQYNGGLPHFDGIECDGGSGWIEGNYVDMRGMTQTSTIMIDNYSYGITAVMVKRNLLRGGGYTVFLDGRFSGGSFPNNVVTFDSNEFGEYTPQNGRLAVGGGMTFIQTNNIDYFTRQVVDLTLPWWQY